MTQAGRLLLAACVATISTTRSGALLAQAAPFGLQWGAPAASLPVATSSSKAGNITSMWYYAPDGFRDIEEVTLKVCDKGGLQQAISVGYRLPGDQARRKFASAFKEAVRRYGEPSDGSASVGVGSWSTARVTMFARLAEPGSYRIFIVQEGPGFESCLRSGPKE